MYNMGGKLLNSIKSMYVNSLACVKVKEGESECFRINNNMRERFIISPCLFNVYMDAAMKTKMGIGRRGVRFQKKEIEMRFLGLLDTVRSCLEI